MGRRSAVTLWLLPALASVGLVVAVVRDGGAVGEALATAGIAPLAIAAVAHLATIVLRHEAWRLALHAVGGPQLRRKDVHAASSVGYLAGTFSPHLTIPIRIALLRRLDPRGAPGTGEMLVSEVPLLAVEASLAALILLAVATSATAGAVAGAALVALGLACLVARGARTSRWAAGLAVLGRPGRRAPLVLLLTAVTVLGLIRAWGVLYALGLEASPADAVLLFAALAIFGALPLGPASAPGAALAATGSATAAVSAGLLVMATTIAAAVAYALILVAVRAPRLAWRRTRPAWAPSGP